MILIMGEKVLHLFLSITQKIIKKFIKRAPIAILNVGGVSNVTIVKSDGSFLGFDIGPGNGPLDTIVSNKTNLDYDADGKISKKVK